MAGNKDLFIAALVVGGLAAAAPAHAQSVLRIARACNDAVDQQLHCASCTSAWPMVTECIARRAYGGRLDPAVLKACIRQVWRRRIAAGLPAAVGDPVSASLRCAGARP
ncbi:MAG: hypothetical protein ACREE4_05460 [Stellaceae bacterium]